MNVEEISGVASIYKQHFFAQLRNATGIDLENIVYYKDETHYFVMTARTKSLIERGVLRKNTDNAEALLDRSNIDPVQLQSYATDAANFATQYKLPVMELAQNSRGNPDVSIFDFTSRYHARYASVIRRCKGNNILGLLVGDALINPFWPTGTGIGKGFLGVLDACWTFREMCIGKETPARILQHRELIYKLLDQTDTSRLNPKFSQYTIDPKTRYLGIQSLINQWDSTQILFLEEDTKGKRRSLAPNKPPATKKQRGSTIKEQETLIYSWLKNVLNLERRYWNTSLTDLPWKNGDILLDLVRKLRPDLIDMDTEVLKTPTDKVELALNICTMHFAIQPLANASEFIKKKPDLLLLLTFLTQFRDNYKNAPLVRIAEIAQKPAVTGTNAAVSVKKSKSPKRSLEKNLSKLAETLKRRSMPRQTKNVGNGNSSEIKCPFCTEKVYFAERYGQVKLRL